MRGTSLAALAMLAAVLLAGQAPAALADAPPTGGATAAADPSPSPTAPGGSTGPTSAAPARTAAPSPGPVRGLAWRASGRGAELRWQAPERAPAGTAYRVLVRSAGAPDRSATTVQPSLLLGAVRAGAHLSASVTAVAGGRAGPTTASPDWVVPATRPSAPGMADLTPLPDRGAIRVRWTAPTDAEAPTGYVVELRSAASPTTVAARRRVAGGVLSVDFPGLRTGSRWFATVAATSAAGPGAARETGTALLQTPATPCSSCGPSRAAATVAPQRAAAPAASPSAPAAIPEAPVAAPADRVPTGNGFPLRLVLAVGGIVLAAVLAITAVLLRRRSALS